ncbi:MAG: LptF/LptG family permease [Marinilabiliaceae bacterium]|nr:LptF/LptG family permease [Marinilabiliaceae bacterium]
MKKLHLFILKSYLGPLILTFFIALFILVMQFLWKYVDDMVGKGLEWLVLAELLFYASLQVVPMAMPLAILLASLMTFGSLGENYELTALKSAGISLPRIMMPLIILTIVISGFAYQFSNNILPVANLKLVSILHGIRETRLELDIKEKVFYDGIDDFTVKVEQKDRETGFLYDVMIYDHRDRQARNSNVTVADSGKFQMSYDKQYLIIKLYDGIRYDEKLDLGNVNKQNKKDPQTFHTDFFKEQTAIVQLQGYDFSKTDESMFRSGDRMKNLNQLIHDLDSLKTERDTQVEGLELRASSFVFSKIRFDERDNYEIIDSAKSINSDSLYHSLSTLQKKTVLEYSLRQARDNKATIEDQIRYIGREESKMRRHEMEIHRKFTLSFACLIFFFIGAPLGAIIRKGGLGLPTVISVLFFVIYYIVDTTGVKFAKEGVWIVYQGMWLSSAILLPIGIFLTYKATTDSTLLNAEAYTIFFQKIQEKIKKFNSPRKIFQYVKSIYP